MAQEIALTLFLHLAEIIIAAVIVSALLKKLKQPTLFAYIVAGILLGPLFLGSIDWMALGLPFELGIPEITPEIYLMSELGTALLLFSVGVETSIKKLMNIGKPILIGTVLQVLLIIGITSLLTAPLGLLSLEQSLFVGTILAFSSTMIVIKLLSDKGETSTLNGRIMISILLVQDFLVILFVPLMAKIGNFSDPSFILPIIGNSIILILAGLFANKIVFPKLFDVASTEKELFFLASIATAFVFIGLSLILEVPISIGAFVAGLALSTLPYNLEIFSQIRALRDFFLTIFFVSLGAELSFAFGGVPIALMAIIFIIIFLIKPLIIFLVTLFAGYGSKTSVRVGIGLGQVSEFGFVLAAIGVTAIGSRGNQIISNELFSFLITAIALSMIITPYLTTNSSRIAQRIYNRVEKLPKYFRKDYFRRKIDELQKVPTKKDLSEHIIIIGGGTVGRGLAKALNTTNQILVVDHDPEVVKQGNIDGLPYMYGNSDNEGLWEKIDIKDAKLVVITILQHEEALEIIKQIRSENSEIKIFATAHYFSETLSYYNANVDFVAMPSIMGSNIFLQNISEFLSEGKLFKIQNFKDEYLNYLKEQALEEKKYKKNNLI
jgi:Kef-type K+ transport system membrane component KefB/voltage-gated potassium channel Kch